MLLNNWIILFRSADKQDQGYAQDWFYNIYIKGSYNIYTYIVRYWNRRVSSPHFPHRVRILLFVCCEETLLQLASPIKV